MGDNKNDEHNASLPSSATILPWKDFEKEVVDYIHKALRRHKLGVDPRNSRVTAHLALYSKDREAKIDFDAAIEVFSPDDKENPILLWLWECKHYETHKVSVDEVEEFHAKMKQVGAHKGAIVTRLGFQEGAIAFAKSKKILLMTLNRKAYVVVSYSIDASARDDYEVQVTYCLLSDGTEARFTETSEFPPLTTIIRNNFRNSHSF